MHRFVHADFAAQTGRRQHANGAGEHRRLVAENIAEHVGRDEDVELFGIANQLHGAIVHQDMLELDSGVAFVLVNPGHHPAPKFCHLEHVSFIDGRDFLAPLERGLKADVSDALDLRCRIHFRVDTALGAVRQFGDTFGLAKIDAAAMDTERPSPLIIGSWGQVSWGARNFPSINT